jgi:hypothetical protein
MIDVRFPEFISSIEDRLAKVLWCLCHCDRRRRGLGRLFALVARALQFAFLLFSTLPEAARGEGDDGEENSECEE